MSKVCIVGNFNIDLILSPLDRMPEWGTESIVERLEARSAGAAGNTALALAGLGVSVCGIGIVGDDYYGKQIIEDLKRASVDTRGIEVVKGGRTCISTALVRGDGERAFVTFLGVLDLFTEAHITRHKALAQGAEYILLCGYFLLPRLGFEGALKLLKWSKEEGKKTLFDTGWDINGWENKTIGEVRELLKYVDVFLPNLEEANALTEDKFSSTTDIARKILSFGCKGVVIKLGGDGSLVMDENGLFTEKAIPTHIEDTSGAGDAFNAGIIYGLMRGFNDKRLLKFANALSSIVISRKENRYPTLKDVEKLLEAI
ncbi:MAG: carbohydrate kinase family protein [bacterium]